MARGIALYTASVQNWAAQLNRLLQDERSPGIPPERFRRARAFVKTEDAHRCLLAHLLLMRSLGTETGTTGTEICLEYGEKGKPEVSGQPDLHFNLSHSGDMVVCAVDCHPVGVDVEKIREIDPDVAQSCFTAAEQSYLNKDLRMFLDRFYQLWTLKESYLKALGTGLSRSPLSVDMKPVTPDIRKWRTGDANTFSMESLDIREGYAAALCGMGEFVVDRMVAFRPDSLT